MPDTTGSRLRAAAALGAANHEDSMYPPVIAVLEELLPTGFHAISHAKVDRGDKPDLQILDRNNALVAHIEVKHSTTIAAAFVVRPGASTHQVGRYRADGIPVILTDAINWYDVTSSDDITRPAVTFNADDTTSDEASAAQLKSWLHTACGVKARHTLETAVGSATGVIALINSAPTDLLADGWSIVRDGLGMTLDDSTLDGGGIGEIVTFTLLSIATQLPELPAATFVAAATNEWTNESSTWNPSDLPVMMGATLRAFRDEDRRLNILGPNGWVAIRSVAAWLAAGGSTDRWARLSNLWDTYLHHVGRRKTLGSWQTPRAVADHQAAEVAAALRTLGYSGLGDTAVTVIDPCCGTGVYLDAVIDRAGAEGRPPEAFNAVAGGLPRLVGVDISSTAVAAAHIRIAASGVHPALHMTDTLSTGAANSLLRLFDDGAGAGNPIVAAARDEYAEVQRWATRDGRRDPILAIIGNPPYLRSGLDRERYVDLGWWGDVFGAWRSGSGGQGGGIMDLFVAFWAWSLNLCQQPHPDLAALSVGVDPAGDGSRFALRGVVSFITNRAWVSGSSFAPMRAWVQSRAAHVSITDFGPGSRGGNAAKWSEQPFAIETGTAIVTLTFDPRKSAGDVVYRRAVWADGGITVGEAVPGAWTDARVSERSLLSGTKSTPGIITTDDPRWVRVDGDRVFAERYAYRAFDNRWSPVVPPTPAPRNRAPLPSEAKPGASWRSEKLFNPHRAHVAAGGWYAILASESCQPGPAIHASRHLIDFHAFKGSEGGRVIPVGAGVATPADFRAWADGHGFDGVQFWLYALAVGHHAGYWTPGTEMAVQLAEKRLEIPLSADTNVVTRLVGLGRELVDLWSLDTVTPVEFTGSPGAWHFAGHNTADVIVVHGRKVLAKWRAARPGNWDQRRATEYARTVAALLRVREIAGEVAGCLVL